MVEKKLPKIMKALLKFGTTEDRARELVEICRKKGYLLQHKNHGEPLTEAIIKEGGFTVNFGGYGSYSRLGLGNNFGTKWEISGLDAPPSKGFTGVDVCFGAGVDSDKQTAVAEYVKKQGGSVSDTGKGDCDVCIVSSSDDNTQSLLETMGAMIDGAKGFIIVPIDEFLSVIPAIKKPRSKAAPSAKLSDELKELQKKLQERDFDVIEGILDSLKGKDADIDLLVQNVSIDSETGELDRGSKFKGTGPALRFLDVALMGLLSIASDSSSAGQLRQSIRKLSFGVRRLPLLRGFTGLEDLEIEIDRVDDETDVIVLDDLSALGDLPSLTSLRIANDSGYEHEGIRIKTLNGLKAPKLKKLNCSNIGLTDISGLAPCTELLSVDLSNNRELSKLDALSAASGLQSLMLNGTAISSLHCLQGCSKIEEINLNDCENIQSIGGLNSSSLQNLELRQLNLNDLNGIEALKGLSKLDLSGLHRVTSLDPLAALGKLQELEVYNLTTLKSLPEMSSMKALRKFRARSCDELHDVTSLGTAPSLAEVSVEECKNVAKGPTAWPKSLTNLSLEKTHLKEIGNCPPTLSELSIRENPELETLSGLEGCKAIKISSWGLDLSGCFALQSLNGLSVPKLDEILIPETMTDLDFLADYPDAKITVVAGCGKQKGYSTIVDDIPAALGDALARLNITELCLRTDWGAELKKVSGIGRVPTLKSLDLSDCNVEDITSISALENLEVLKVQPRTELSKALGKATFDTKGQVDKLRLKLLAGL